MSFQIIDCEQNSPEWFAARMGIPTASEFDSILTAAKGKAVEGKMRNTYLWKLAGELLTGDPMESVTTRHMERGKFMEDEARDLYAFLKNVEPQRVGFIRSGVAGCSPDSLLGENGGMEIKTALPHIQIGRLIKDELPQEHKAQVYGSIWLTEREWWDFVSYCSPKLPLFVKRVYRDEDYIKSMAEAVALFDEDLQKTVETIRNYGKEAIAA